MPEFAERQRQTDRSHLVSPAKPDRAMPQPARAANPDQGRLPALVNQAKQWFAQSCPLALPSPGLCPFGGVCHTCSPRAQAKLKTSHRGDRFEQEARRVATQVTRTPEPRVQREVGTAQEEVEREGGRFRGEVRRGLAGIIAGMRFRKILNDCPTNMGVRLQDVLSNAGTS